MVYQELFLGKKIGDVIYTDNEGLREYFNEQMGSNFNFCVTIKDIVPHSYVCLDQLKKQFRIKTNKELHQKLIEVFSYRNDISQRKAMIDEACKLMLSKHPFSAPHFLILRQEEELTIDQYKQILIILYIKCKKIFGAQSNNLQNVKLKRRFS